MTVIKKASWLLPVLILVLPVAWVAGCAAPSYYAQAVSGHLSLMRGRQDIEDILNSESADPELARKLGLAVSIREFAILELGLPEDGGYTQFSATGRDAVTWNVVATGEFSLQARQWCFPVAGCVPYRGYFEREAARKFADRLRSDAYDVMVSPAVAYSTLGWFDDPLTDTMLQYGEEQLAAFIFHEMAHQKLYIKGDTGFNEAFASFVEEVGVRLWLESTGSETLLADWRREQAASAQFNALLHETRAKLNAVYVSEKPAPEKRASKAAIFEELKIRYAALESGWDGRSYYSGWMSRELNNAGLALIDSYRGGVCAFRKLYLAADGDMALFHELAAARSALDQARRSKWLNQPCSLVASNGDL
jgi:predicted aminopeptidase